MLELNVRTWLRGVAMAENRPITLACVPDAVIEAWRGMRLTHLWLMGLWPTGPRSRNHAKRSDALASAFDAAAPGWKEADVCGSPYAISTYAVPRSMGGPEGLARFRRQLSNAGIRLVLDFVPNHVGLDHAWVREHPEWFIEAAPRAEGASVFRTAKGARWLAHGGDPYFAPWADTVQVNLRNPGAREALVSTLEAMASICDGVRCDMAMLALNEVFDRTWPLAGGGEVGGGEEFWTEAIGRVRQAHAGFEFIAEVYWDLEARLQSLGFDFTYDKRLYDYLVGMEPENVLRHLGPLTTEYLSRSLHFLENHDEARVAGLLASEAHRAATLVVMALPGMVLIHEGQMDGARIRQPIQLGLPVQEPVDHALAEMHRALLGALEGAGVGASEARLLRPQPAWEGNLSWQSFVVILLEPATDRLELVVVNLASHRAQCHVALGVSRLAAYNWKLCDRLGPERHERSGEDMLSPGLYLDVPAHAAQVFSITPIGYS
jgi:hypothetical protein